MKYIKPVLQQLAAGRPTYPDSGICDHLGRFMGVAEAARLVAKYAESWEHYSGSRTFPVPHPDPWPADFDGESYELAIHAYHYLPKWQGAYGELRADLAAHILECLENV